MEKRIVTYNKYGQMIDTLVKKIDGHAIHGELKFIHGPQRGGLPIAVHMSHHLGLRFVSDYEFHEQFTQDMREKTLIVDDVTDTGKTLQTIGSVYNYKPITAVLFLKDRSVITPDYWVEIDNRWVIFPWEKIDETPNREGYGV